MRVSAEARALARNIVDNKLYRENLLSRATRGALPPGVETMLWHYAFGKPPDVVDMQVSDMTQAKLQEMTPEQLSARAIMISEGIKLEAERLRQAATATASEDEDTSFMQEPQPLDPSVLEFKPRTH